MASHALPPLSNISDCRRKANELLVAHPDDALAKHLLAWCEISEGRFPEEIFAQLSEPFEARVSVPIELRLGWLLALCNRGHEALNRLSEDLDIVPGDEDTRVLIGICLQRTRNFSGLVEDFGIGSLRFSGKRFGPSFFGDGTDWKRIAGGRIGRHGVGQKRT